MTKIETQTPATAGIQNEAILEADTNNPTALESTERILQSWGRRQPAFARCREDPSVGSCFCVLLTLSFSVIEFGRRLVGEFTRPDR